VLSEEEKAHIVEKIKFEAEVRKSLQKPCKSGKAFSWLNSKIGLLLVGSLITGLLVPWFQFTQKTIEWKRQNQFDRVNYKLDMMRDCLKNFVLLQAYRAEAYERLQPFVVKAILTASDYADFKKQFITLQNKYFSQNAKVTSLIIAFTAMDKGNEASERLRQLFQDYIRDSTLYMRDIDDLVKQKYCASNSRECLGMETDITPEANTASKLKQYMTNLNRSHASMVYLMTKLIREEERKNENFLF